MHDGTRRRGADGPREGATSESPRGEETLERECRADDEPIRDDFERSGVDATGGEERFQGSTEARPQTEPKGPRGPPTRRRVNPVEVTQVAPKRAGLFWVQRARVKGGLRGSPPSLLVPSRGEMEALK
eukprot:5846154-Pyramimonas_sp.AAC.1